MIAEYYDIPDLTGSVIWNYEIHRKLKKSISNLGSVMGDDWTKTPTGKKITDYEDYFSVALKEGDQKIEKFKDVYEATEMIEKNIFVVRKKLGS